MSISKKTALTGILTALALILHIIEAQIPVIISVPGIKLGLANITTIFCLYLLGFRQAFTVLLLRCILGSFFSGQIMGLIYSLSGGILSILVMTLFKKNIGGFSVPSISVIGAIFHNIGQIIASIFITETKEIILYLPFLLAAGIITGYLTGIISKICIKKLSPLLSK